MVLLHKQQEKLADFNLNKIAFVIGNGTSRRTISFPDLSEKGSTYGCNAIYREFSPDYLIAVEEGATLVRVGNAIFGQR